MFVYSTTCIISILLSSKLIRYSHNDSKNMKARMILSALPLIIVSSLRYGIGTDYLGYFSIFNHIKAGEAARCEYLFKALTTLIIKMGASYQWLLFAVSLITLLFLFLAIFDESPYIGLSIFLIFGTYFYFVSMNQIRFTMGAAILLYAVRYVERQDFLRFIIFVLIAGGFHSICYTFVIIYFLYNKLIARKTIVISSILIFIFRNQIETIARIIMRYTKYAPYLDSEMDTMGTPVVYLAVQTVIILFLTICFSPDAKYTMYFNIEVVNYWITLGLGRLPEVERFRWVYGLSAVIAIPLAISNIKDSRWRLFAKLAIIVLYGIYSYYLLVNNIGNHTPLPYRSILSR